VFKSPRGAELAIGATAAGAASLSPQQVDTAGNFLRSPRLLHTPLAPAEEREAKADQYVNEVETAAKARKNTKLPELTVSAFEGKVMEWPRFKAKFNSIVGSRADLPETIKLAYLVGACKGEALRLVKQYQATNTPFASVMAALEARFGRPYLQLKQAFNAIAKLDPGQHSATDTRHMLDKLKPLLVTIHANNVDTELPSFGAMLLMQIGPKI
jgi:hypothetical protein